MNHRYFSSFLRPHLELTIRRVTRQQTIVDLAYLGCALERYRIDQGNWPARLDDLAPHYIKEVPVDVLTGEPYYYCLDGKGRFILYSLGMDGKDNPGDNPLRFQTQNPGQ